MLPHLHLCTPSSAPPSPRLTRLCPPSTIILFPAAVAIVLVLVITLIVVFETILAFMCDGCSVFSMDETSSMIAIGSNTSGFVPSLFRRLGGRGTGPGGVPVGIAIAVLPPGFGTCGVTPPSGRRGRPRPPASCAARRDGGGAMSSRPHHRPAPVGAGPRPVLDITAKEAPKHFRGCF